MAEEQTQFQAETPETQTSSAEKSPLAEELNRLGRNFSQLIREALESPQFQEIRREIATSAQTVIEEVNEVIVKARESQVTQEVVQRASSTVEELKTSPVAENIKVGLLNTLRSVNEELSELVEKMEKNVQPKESVASEAVTQEINDEGET